MKDKEINPEEIESSHTPDVVYVYFILVNIETINTIRCFLLMVLCIVFLCR